MSGLIGIDEVGRGAWAGPVCVAAVRLNKPVEGLKDSKLLTRKDREKLALKIRQNAVVSIGWTSVSDIDLLGLTAALSNAMRKALRTFSSNTAVMIDGSYNFLPERTNVTVRIKADLTEPVVAAASIIAKVARDNLMVALSYRFPDYGFERHVGYGTAEHRLALNSVGISAVHRLSFLPVKNLKSP